MKADVESWIKSGASLGEGIRLFCLHSSEEHPFVKLCKRYYQQCKPILVQELALRSGISSVELKKLTETHGGSFRENWPFLNQPDCPLELKILAANKITAYWNYVNAHRRLFDCRTKEEQLATVKEVVENFMENRAIIAEFVYYREHGHVLGKHPIFQEFRNYKQLRRLNPVELIKRKTSLEHNIWRIESELSKNDKPHLKVDRERRLQQKKNELAEVDRLIEAIK
ncbi:hypothetical protein [Mongoliitalea lutea]|uniref:Uncharacterized protein n=1 Tax=Mongoliitalea lutea TaxID=849756 RepID=A0A8J3CYF8_9BACT|nr:hypothetical protein [Mongoliitalea lutea]GHB44455.1 hypothetical protein GCM10008106_26910 [Mongoliitalea lutea]